MVRSLLATLALALAGSALVPGVSQPVRAEGSVYQVQPVDASKFILVAAPIGAGASAQLNIYEQYTSKRPCFAVRNSSAVEPSSESSAPTSTPADPSPATADAAISAGPVVVDPLLTKFDHTGICRWYIDSNGFSLRVGGDDLGTKYRLTVRKTNNDVVLVAVPRSLSASTHVVARAGGVATAASDFLKLELEPGWKLMRRHYGTRAQGHIYLFREFWPGEEPQTAPAGTPEDQPAPEMVTPAPPAPES